ncbi:putative endonuclease [Sphingobium sp. AP50]|uniref:GIY-YIG nuclease family protein n=1 Tax=Sphingobium sp. AP50 TaxID=1884369 RepID=UPI0008B1B924|nr:GIY-YIG nuclease family protein [Sphingobium sp. AP50]SEJ59772.1 putative endonuclease [Sphingobium sp. AP50]SEJ69187.1 putative endonuclease [Sphingobium sp. AP50]
MAFWTYMLKCSDGRYYTGHTDNLDHRIGQHQCGQGSQFTRNRLPVTLVWSETFGTCIEALEAERIIGGWSRAKKEAMIAGNWSLVSYLAKPPKERQTKGPFVSSVVEKREECARRFSTTLETNGYGMPDPEQPA